MTTDWCPSIREFCVYWRNAPTLQMTFQALEQALADGNDSCIGAAKGIVECACQVLIAELDDPSSPESDRPDSPLRKADPSLGEYLSTVVRMMKLSDGRHDPFNKIISAHNKLATELNSFRNRADPLSHGKDGFAGRLTEHHRRVAVITADSIIAYLHYAYLERDIDPDGSLEPYERFEPDNWRIDALVGMEIADDDIEGTRFKITFGRSDERYLTARVSQLLFAVDRKAYRDARDFARSIPNEQIQRELADDND
ncbi:abortive infection family protein [Rhizobium leguminosarum]|uniref:abortive infection family protein n=1 Tax=Rhizobium leguminosarum TaxID=384 RepID=UPI001C975E12|nr:abortive infection family protein [Rhizobium leguminosarum]MBY5735603.1 abortive infection family protein [Rhizobium leguminosarum]